MNSRHEVAAAQRATGSGFHIALVAVIVLWAIYDISLAHLSVSALHGNDFGKFYLATRQWADGYSMYARNIATKMEVGSTSIEFLDMNPPHFHLIVLPFTYFPLHVAAYLWLAVNAAAACLSVILIAREVSVKLTRTLVLALAALCLSSAATGANFVTGQYSGLLLLGVSCAWIAARRRRNATWGLILGVLVALKPFLALFAPVMLLRKEYSALIWTLVGGALSVGVGYAVFGPDAYEAWFATLRSVTWTWAAMNGSLLAVLNRTLGPSPYYQSLNDLPQVAGPVWFLGSISVAFATLRVSRRSIDHAFGATVLAALIVAPLGWVYYLWLATPALAALWMARVPHVAVAGLALCSIPLGALFIGQPSWIATLTIGSAYSWGVGCLWLAVVASDAQPSRAEASLL